MSFRGPVSFQVSFRGPVSFQADFPILELALSACSLARGLSPSHHSVRRPLGRGLAKGIGVSRFGVSRFGVDRHPSASADQLSSATLAELSLC